eukprot:TRINITY_DN50308_c0_g1_i1.p2 TRINITY_DN50308_c0_g1~~TRINITY_DN50308_c0_g1_i1.p2  ORF type:complete len:162 (+),score=30.86 TRINITY_DN50308_c0_g1_i1:165-650(+)
MSLLELQSAMLPGAMGTAAIVFSCVNGILRASVVSYAVKRSPPYKPWSKEHDDEKLLRASRATENQQQWATYTMPLVAIAAMYTPGLPKLWGLQLGTVLPWCNFGLCVAYAWFNDQFCKGYIVSAEDRLKPFQRRTTAFKGILALSLVGMIGFGVQWRLGK